MSDWEEYLLEDLADDITVGFVGSMADEYVEKGITFLRSKNVDPHRINLDDIRYITPEFHQKIKKSALTPGDVVIVRTGKPGAASIIPDYLTESNCSDLVIVRPSSNLDRHFLVYYLNSIAVHYINSYLVGAVQQHFNIGAARKLKITLPKIKEQKRVSDVLSCLDAKIDNLRRQNETLEEIARSIFKHWFIDFEFPNPDGKPYKSSGGAMVRSDLGDIPEGWRVQRFDSLGELNRGKSRHRPRYAEHLYGGIYPFIQTGDIKSSQGFITEYEQTYSNAGLAQSRLWEKETLCITIAANIAETGILTFSTCFPDSVIGFVADASVCDVYFIHRMFKIKKKEIEIEAIGSVQKNLNLENISKIKFVIPNIEEQNDLIMMFRKLGNKIICTKQKIQTLTKTRDTLLPKLMSGQLRVKE